MKKRIIKRKIRAKIVVADPVPQEPLPLPGRWTLVRSWFLETFLKEDAIESEAPAKIFNKGAFLAFSLFSGFAVIILWSLLVHSDSVPGQGDIANAFALKYRWIQGLKEGNPVFWNPYTSLGQPFVAMCSPGPYSLFNFLFLIFPIAYALTLSYLFHFIISAFGTYLFIRALGCGWVGACLGGFAFAFSGFFMGHFYAGHPLMVMAACWIPLVLFGVKRFTDKRIPSMLILAAVAMGFCFLEGMPQISMYAMMFSGLLLGWGWIRRKINWIQLLGAEITFIFISISCALCQLAPAYQFAQWSDRWIWQWNDLMKDFFSASYFRVLIQPFSLGTPGGDIGRWGYHEMIIYIGLIPIFLALFGLLWLFPKRPFVWWLFLIGLFSTLLAMGDSTPFTHSFYLFFFNYLPGFGHNRSVGRIMVITAFVFSCLAGLGLDGWIRFWKVKSLSPAKRIFLLVWVPSLLLIGTLVDLWHFDIKHILNTSVYDIRNPDSMLNPDLMAKIKADPTFPRVQPEEINDPEVIFEISAVMTGYSIFTETTHKFLAEQWRYNETPLPDLIRLTYRFQRPEWKISDRWQPLPGYPRYMTDTKAFPRAFMVGGYEVDPDTDQTVYDIRDSKVDAHQEVILTADPEGKPAWPKGWVGEAKITHYDFNDLEMECTNNRPCFLFLSDTYYPGWKAWVDGNEEPIYEGDSTFRVVELKTTGHHLVKMSYHPFIITGSFFYSLLTWIILFIAWIFRGRLNSWISGWFFRTPVLSTPLILGKETLTITKVRSPKTKKR